jgi:GTPase SAR1 family protein
MCPLLVLLCHFPLVVGRVGKTSLVLWYVNNVFSDKHEATVQASYLTKRLVVEGVPITLSIWVCCHLFDMY